LYHWTKYVKKRVSIFNKSQIKTWKVKDDDVSGPVKLVRVEESRNVLADAYNSPSIVGANHRDPYLTNNLPYKDFEHFVQKLKPWLNKKLANNPHGHVDKPKKASELWFNTLRKIESEYNFGINTKNVWNGRPSLGTYPAHSMVQQKKDAKSQ
jgi:hypothetical protein